MVDKAKGADAPEDVEENVEEKVETEKTEVITELEKSEVSQPESKSTVIMTVGDGSSQPGQNMTETTVALVSPPSSGQHAPSPRVKIKISYPKGYKKEKHFFDGDVKEVAPETADQFIQAGIATIVEEVKEQ